jgi:hypothetical protein
MYVKAELARVITDNATCCRGGAMSHVRGGE